MIHVRVLLFAMLAESAGRRELELELPAGSRVADAVRALAERAPALAPWVDRVSYAVNRTYAEREAPLAEGDELALLPPVSGGSVGDEGVLASAAGGRFLVSRGPLSLDRAAALVTNPASGAVCVFAGTVRELTGSHRTSYLEYDAYPEMAVEEMARIAEEIDRRWPGAQVAIHHRIGRLDIGDVSVVVAAATPHRQAAFEACRYGIDELKRRVPVWKKEVYADGSHWVGRDGTGPWSEGDAGPGQASPREPAGGERPSDRQRRAGED